MLAFVITLSGISCGGDSDPAPADGAVADVAEPDAAAAECNGDSLVSGAGCGAAGKCSLQFTQTQIAVGCCPIGDKAVGAACNPLAAQSKDHPGFVCDDCGVGIVCVDFVCEYYCDGRDLICPDGLTCFPEAGIAEAPNYGHCE